MVRIRMARRGESSGMRWEALVKSEFRGVGRGRDEGFSSGQRQSNIPRATSSDNSITLSLNFFSVDAIGEATTPLSGGGVMAIKHQGSVSGKCPSIYSMLD